MHINTIKWIDSYIGPPLCILLGFLKAVQDFIRRPIPAERVPKKILIIKFWGMGSILLASPAMRAIKAKFPSAEITLLTLSQNRDLAEMLPAIDRVQCFHIGNILTFPLNFFKMIRAIRQERFAIIIDLEFFANFTAIATFFSGIPFSVGFTTPKFWRDRFYNLRVSFDHSRHASKIFLKVAQSLGGDHEENSFDAERLALLKNEDTDFIDGFFARNCSEKRPLVSFNINASAMCLRRRWPAEYFAELAEWLINAGFTVLMIGGKEDKDYVNAFLRLIEPSPYLINLCGKTNINQLVSLLKMSDLFIGNDSGPLHLAAILGIPTISFFGPETPYLYGPQGDNNHVFYEDLYCSPCLNVYNSKTTRCNDNICLKSIKPEKVLSAIRRII